MACSVLGQMSLFPWGEHRAHKHIAQDDWETVPDLLPPVAVEDQTLL